MTSSNSTYSYSHDTFSGWFLTMLRTGSGLGHQSEPRMAASLGRVPPWWWLVEHPYRVTMLTAGVVSWPLRRLQASLGRGEELLALARREE